MKKKLHHWCNVFVVLFCSTLLLLTAIQAQGQTAKIQVSGKIVDENNKPIEGVTISIKSEKGNAISKADGTFTIMAEAKSTLIITAIGYAASEVAVNGKNSVEIRLMQNTSSLEDVVVVGYGSRKKGDVTGAIASVSGEKLRSVPTTNITVALQGKVAGIEVLPNSFRPGAGASIRVRGNRSLSANNEPLYVVDGIPVTYTIDDMSPNDIESIDVLKDASSTAIYGSRAANGVILIQTKRGSVGKPVVNFSSSYGIQEMPKPMEVMSPYEFIKYQTELNPLTATTRAFFAGGKTLEDYKSTAGVNFQDYVLQQGAIQNYNLALRGGTDQTKYSISGSLFDQIGSIINTGLNRYSGRATLDQNISNKIKAGVTVNYSGIKQYGQVINQGAVTQGNPTAFALARAWLYRPISPNPNDDLLADAVDDDALNASDFRVNPFIDLQNQHSFNITNLVETNGYLSYEINKNLNIQSNAGIRHNKLTLERFYNSKTAQGGPSPNNVNGVNGSISNLFTNSFSNETTLNYKKTFKKDHTITGLGLFAINSNNTNTKGYAGRLLPNENLGMDGLEEGLAFNPVSSSSVNTMASYAGRLDYNYKSKYIVTGTFRADGSSKFREHWGYFPGAALAWNMHKEGFFAKILPGISTSKIRTSYGSNGNNRVGDFDTYARLLQSVNGYSFNQGTPIASNSVSSIGNPDLAWEKVTTIDLGYEIGILKDRVVLEMDLYRKTTENLLLNAILPSSTGFTSAVKNIGKLRNDGLELTLNTVNVQSKNFSWQSNLNISFNKNKVMELTRGQRSLTSNSDYVSQFNKPLYVAEIGKPAGMMIGFIWEGNYQYSDFDNPSPGVYILKPSVPTNGAVRNTILPGDIKYKDINGDGIMNDADLTFIGSGQPIHTGGFSNNFNYKAFSLNVFFQWSYGNDIYNANRLIMEGNSNGWANINQFASYSNRWSPENPTNANYRTRGQGPIGFHSSRVVEDGSFIRMKTVSLNYNLPAKLIKTAYLSNLSVNVSAQNLITWTNYSGMDPEVSTRNNTLTPGFDYSSYPKSPTIAFGIKAGF